MKRNEFIRSIGVLGASALGFRLLSKAEAATSVLQLSEYPDPLPLSGALHQQAIFDYFKKAFLDSDPWNAERWPMFEDTDFTYWYFIYDAPLLPMTRSQFYAWVDSYSVDPSFGSAIDFFGKFSGNSLYTFPSVALNWPVRAVNDWAKIKCLELALFGSLGNGSDLSKSSDIGSGDFATAFTSARRSDLYLLRRALVKFESYGECHEENVYSPPPPASLTANIGDRSFSFGYASGYSSFNQYEYSVDGGVSYSPVTGNPQSLSHVKSNIRVGDLRVRVSYRGVYETFGEDIGNSTEYPAIETLIFVSVSGVGGGSLFITANLIDTVGLSDSVNITVSIVNNGFPEILPSLTLRSGEMSVSREFPGSYTSVSITGATSIPTVTSDGRPIYVKY